MRKDLGVKPIIYPQPVFIIATYDENGKPDAMNAAWGGLSDNDQISICCSASHRTTKNILARKAFTVSMATASQVTACDYVGIVSGDKEPDKIEKSGFHVTRSAKVDAPVIDELPLTFECELISFEADYPRLIGRIVNVSADESILKENGKIDVEKLDPITFDGSNNVYYRLGEIAGEAFKCGAVLK